MICEEVNCIEQGQSGLSGGFLLRLW